MATFAELLAPMTTQQQLQAILNSLAAQNPPLPVNDWGDDNAGRILALAFANSLVKASNAVASIASGLSLPKAQGLWLDLLASQNYQMTRLPAIYAQGLVQLTDAGGGPHTITANVTTVASGSLRYVATAEATLPLNGKIFVPFICSKTGLEGNVANNRVTNLTTALVGVSVSNPIPWIITTGAATAKTRGYVQIAPNADFTALPGQLKFIGTGDLVFYNQNTITLTSGIKDSVVIQAEEVGSKYNLGNDVSWTVYYQDSTDYASASNPALASGNWLTTAGASEETDDFFRQRVQLSQLKKMRAPTQKYIQYFCSGLSIPSGSRISKVQTVSNVQGAGTVNIYAADPSGYLEVQDQEYVQQAVDGAGWLLYKCFVLPAVVRPVTIAGTVKVRAGYRQTEESAALKALSVLFDNTPIGGTVHYADIVSAILRHSYNSSGRNTNTNTLRLDLVSPTADVGLAYSEVAIMDMNLVWEEVS